MRESRLGKLTLLFFFSHSGKHCFGLGEEPGSLQINLLTGLLILLLLYLSTKLW